MRFSCVKHDMQLKCILYARQSRFGITAVCTRPISVQEGGCAGPLTCWELGTAAIKPCCSKQPDYSWGLVTDQL